MPASGAAEWAVVIVGSDFGGKRSDLQEDSGHDRNGHAGHSATLTRFHTSGIIKL
jgi:hypothetical protein